MKGRRREFSSAAFRCMLRNTRARCRASFSSSPSPCNCPVPSFPRNFPDDPLSSLLQSPLAIFPFSPCGRSCGQRFRVCLSHRRAFLRMVCSSVIVLCFCAVKWDGSFCGSTSDVGFSVDFSYFRAAEQSIAEKKY